MEDDNRDSCDLPEACEDRFEKLETGFDKLDAGQRQLSEDIAELARAIEVDMRTMRHRVNRLAAQTEDVTRALPLIEAVDSRQPDMLHKLGALREGLADLVGKVDALATQVRSAVETGEGTR